jgi:hypothetical protein
MLTQLDPASALAFGLLILTLLMVMLFEAGSGSAISHAVANCDCVGLYIACNDPACRRNLFSARKSAGMTTQSRKAAA